MSTCVTENFDQQIGRVVRWLEETGETEKTIIVVVSDHGEGLGDHDWWTHGILYEEQIRVPLIIRAPAISAGRRVDHLVRTIDIMPTVLDLVGLEADRHPAMEGSSLLPLLQNESPNPKYLAYSDSLSSRVTYSHTEHIRDVKDEMLLSVSSGPWKYIHHLRRSDESEFSTSKRIKVSGSTCYTIIRMWSVG